MIKIGIVDDEFMAVKTLTVMLEKYMETPIEIRGESDFDQALDMIKEFKPDLLLLDIMMPPHTGFELLAQCQKRTFHVIFTTAYDNYAIQAIRYSALDYVLKPISATELMEAMSRFIQHHAAVHPEPQFVHLLQNLHNKSIAQFTLAIPTLEKTYFVSPADLMRCESDSNYTWFFLKNGEKIIASKTMKSFESILADHGFERVHRSHLVNKKFIDTIEKHDMIRMKDGTLLPVARTKKGSFMSGM